MDKRPSFESDLNAIAYEVDTSLEGMVQALSGSKSASIKAHRRQRDKNMTETENQSNEESVVASVKGPRRRSSKSSLTPEPAVLVNVTTRLSRETNELLTEASLHQRLKRVTPNTRQDVIEVALREWYERNGYA